jgi:hypothetical protein
VDTTTAAAITATIGTTIAVAIAADFSQHQCITRFKRLLQIAFISSKSYRSRSVIIYII